MNTKLLFSSVLVSSLVLVAACTPRDVRVSSEETRAKIRTFQDRNKGKYQKGRNPGDFALFDSGLTSFLAQRQVEAIEFIKLATNSLDAKKTHYDVSEESVRESGAKAVSLTSISQPFSYSTELGAWKGKSTKSLSAEFVKIDTLESFELTGAGLTGSVDSVEKERFYVNLKEDSYSLTAGPSDKTEFLKVVLKTKGSIGGAKGGKNIINDIAVSITMLVDKASLESSEVHIASTQAKIDYPSPVSKNKTFFISFVGKDLVVKFNGGLCSSLDGTINVSAGPKTKFDMTFTENEIKTSRSNRTLPACGSRPTVDLSLFQ